MSEKKAFNVVLNSQHKISTGASLSDCTFGMDWTNMKDGPYEVHFTFISKVMNLSTADIACINVDFGGSNVYESFNGVGNRTSNYIGVAKPYLISTSSYLLSEDSTNPPITLNCKPTNNLINVIINASDNETAYAPTTGAMLDWILNLQFIPI